MQTDIPDARCEKAEQTCETSPALSSNDPATKRAQIPSASSDARATFTDAFPGPRSCVTFTNAFPAYRSCATLGSVHSGATVSSPSCKSSNVFRDRNSRPVTSMERLPSLSGDGMSSSRHCAIDDGGEGDLKKLRLETGIGRNNLLRGVPTGIIMANCSHVFANSHGTREEYEKSENVQFLDAFLSHSWRDSRWHKWIAMLFHFNFPMALRVACVTAVFLFATLLLIFAIVQAPLEDITTNVVIGQGASEVNMTGFLPRETLRHWESSINSTIARYPTNTHGCKPWEEVPEFNLSNVESRKITLMLRLEGCNIQDKMNNLQKYLRLVSDGNKSTERIDLVVIWSDIFMSARHSTAQRLLMELNDYFDDPATRDLPTWSPVMLLNKELNWEKLSCGKNQCDGKRVFLEKPGRLACAKATEHYLETLLHTWNFKWAALVVLSHIPSILFFIVLLLWHHSSPKHVFLDKLCINQESEEHIQKGVEALPIFLHHSKRLIVFWTETYFTRLWCVYEVARFLATHDTKEVDFYPVSLCVLVVGSSAATWIANIIFDFFATIEPFLADPVFCLSKGEPLPDDQMERMEWQLPLTFFICWFILFLNVSLFRAAGRAHRLLKTQVQRFCFDNALSTKLEDKYAIEDDLGKWFAEGGLAESRAFQAVAVAILAKVESQESIGKNDGCTMESQPGGRVKILTPWKRMQESCTARSSGSPSKSIPMEGVVRNALKQGRICDTDIFDGLSADRQRRAFELWVRTGVFQDISSFLGTGTTLKFKWIIYSVLPSVWAVPLGCLQDPFSSGFGFCDVERVFRSLTIAYCIIPLFCLLMNHLYASKRLNRTSKWIRRKLHSTGIWKPSEREEPGSQPQKNTFTSNIYTNLLYSLFGLFLLWTFIVLTMIAYAYAGDLDEHAFVTRWILLVMFVTITAICFQCASGSTPQFDIPLRMDDIFADCVETEFDGLDPGHTQAHSNSTTTPRCGCNASPSCTVCQSMNRAVREKVTRSLSRYGSSQLLSERECDDVQQNSVPLPPLVESAVSLDVVTPS